MRQSHRVVPLWFDRVFLTVQSLLDDAGLADVSSAAEAVKKAVEQQQFTKATELWSVTETVVEQVSKSSMFGSTDRPNFPKFEIFPVILKLFFNPLVLKLKGQCVRFSSVEW